MNFQIKSLFNRITLNTAEAALYVLITPMLIGIKFFNFVFFEEVYLMFAVSFDRGKVNPEDIELSSIPENEAGKLESFPEFKEMNGENKSKELVGNIINRVSGLFRPKNDPNENQCSLIDHAQNNDPEIQLESIFEISKKSDTHQVKESAPLDRDSSKLTSFESIETPSAAEKAEEFVQKTIDIAKSIRNLV